MKSRQPLLKSLLGKLRKKTAAAEGPARLGVRRPAARKVVSSIEGLEGRIAPATLVSATTVSYTDLDGDLVTVKFSKPILSNPTVANLVLKFSSGAGAVGAGNATTEQLWMIDLTTITALATGTSISVTATAGGGRNGAADVGQIKANNVALGTVIVDGDLGQVDAGRGGVKTALAVLDVGSLGVRGLATQDPASTTRDIISSIAGTLGAVKIRGDMKEARITVANGSSAGGITPLGNVGSIVIEGSLLGATAVGAASNSTGRIDAAGNIGSVRVGTDASDGIFGGGGDFSGQILAGGKMGNVTVSGKLVGAAGASSGTIFAETTMGAVKIGLDPTGGITGGAAINSGSVQAGGSIASAFVRGDVRGSDGQVSGSILAGGALAKVTITGDLAGGVGENSGRVQAFTTLGSVTIGEDLIAGAGLNSGGLSANAIGTVTVQDIDARTASASEHSAGIAANKLNSLLVKGSLFGGSGRQSGFVEIAGDIGAVTVQGSIVGGTGQASASVIALGKLGSATVNGSLTGGNGIESAEIVSGFDPVRVGDMGPVKVLGSIVGGVGDKSGSIRSGGALKSVVLGTAGPTALDVLKGGDGDRSGYIESQGLLGSLKIIGNLVGGAGDFSGTVRSADRFETSGEIAGDLGAVSITGQLRGGAGTGSGGLLADGNLASLTVGSWVGGTGAESGVVETGAGIVRPGNSGAIRVLGTFAEHATTPGVDSASLLIGGNLSSLTVNGFTDGVTVRVWDAAGALSFKANVSDSLVTARGQVKQGATTDVAIRSISVVGSVTDSSFLAGYRLDAALNADAQIGAVVVTGTWTRSNLVAGVVDTDADGFGDEDDAAIAGGSSSIVSRIASVIIGGTVIGTFPSGDHFGFVAQKVGAFKLDGVAQTTRPVQVLLSPINDVAIREVPVL